MSSEGKNSAGATRQAAIMLPDLADFIQLDHDLRATLADLAAGLDLIGDDALTPAARPALKRSRAAVSMLHRLLEDGLQSNLSPSEHLARSQIDLPRFAAEMLERWQDEGGTAGSAVEMWIDPAISAHSLTDRVALERMVANLIWNARRYSQSGRVLCTIGVEGNNLCLVVSDKGPGFPQDRLTPGTVVLRSETSDGRRSSGLGLIIARKMAAKLGGQLSLYNPPEGGAEVTFRMPLSGPAPADVLQPEPLPDLAGIRILVADDSESIRLVTERVLCALGATVELCVDGRTAMEALSLRPFDVLVLDVEMPGFGGLDVLRALRESPLLLLRPATVMMTGHSHRADREAFRDAGADAVLVKPVLCPYALGEAVIGAVRRREGRASGAKDSLVLPDETTLNRLLQIAGADTGTELLVRLLDDLKTIEERLLGALPDLDFAAIRAQTHVLISVAGAVGAVGLQCTAERLNTAANGKDAVAIKDGLARLLTVLDALIQIIADKQVRTGPRTRA